MQKGDRIRNLREAKNMTQGELAKRLHTTKQTISKYEKGIVTNIPSDRIEGIALALDTTPEYILGWENGTPEEQAEFEASILTDDNVMDMIRKFMALSEEKKNAVIRMIDVLSSE